MSTERKFKGVWIPKAIWEHPDLTWLQKCVAGEIDSMSDESEPCTAGDDYLGAMFGVGVRRMANILSELRGLKVIETVTVSGKKRGLRLTLGFTESVSVITKPVRKELTDSVNTYKGVPSIEKNGKTPVRVFTDGWIEAFGKHFKFKYSFQGVKDAQAAVRLIALEGPDELLRIAQEAWRKSDDRKHWSCVNQSQTIAGFASAFNRIRIEVTNGTPRQQNNQRLNGIARAPGTNYAEAARRLSEKASMAGQLAQAGHTPTPDAQGT